MVVTKYTDTETKIYFDKPLDVKEHIETNYIEVNLAFQKETDTLLSFNNFDKKNNKPY